MQYLFRFSLDLVQFDVGDGKFVGYCFVNKGIFIMLVFDIVGMNFIVFFFV